jgi:hypothetical protein
MFIAELFGREQVMLDAVEATREAVLKAGYPPEREFNCCAQDVRSTPAFERLRGLVRPSRYSYTLECFSNRVLIMGKYKGLPMSGVIGILERARAAGFAEIQLNYVFGLDSLEQLEAGFTDLARRGLVDSVGLSTYTVFWTEGWRFRAREAFTPDYYLKAVSILRALGIQSYRPESYDMPVAYAALLRKTTL